MTKSSGADCPPQSPRTWNFTGGQNTLFLPSATLMWLFLELQTTKFTKALKNFLPWFCPWVCQISSET